MDEMKLHRIQGIMLDILGYIHKSSTEKNPDYKNVVMNIHHDLLHTVSEDDMFVPRTKGFMQWLPTVPARFSEEKRFANPIMDESREEVVRTLMDAVGTVQEDCDLCKETEELLQKAMEEGAAYLEASEKVIKARIEAVKGAGKKR